MAYEIVMPQLSDSMEEGKLISWNVKEGDSVKNTDVIAEVESDKAIMELQSFKDGIVKYIYIKEGESVPVGTTIAEIETDAAEYKASSTEKTKPTLQISKEKVDIVKSDTLKKPEKSIKEEPPPVLQTETDIEASTYIQKKGAASPKAKALAAHYGFDIEALQHSNKLPSPLHESEIRAYALKHYFTAKAQMLLKKYNLQGSDFNNTKKYDSAQVLDYIKENNIPLPQPIEPFKRALIEAVTYSAQKPVYHIYDKIDASLLQKYTEYTITVWLIKLIASAMIEHESFRSTLEDNRIQIWPNASLSLAVSHGNYLYMPVIQNANQLTLPQIAQQLKVFEEKARDKKLQRSQMQGSTFGISNLGMLGIERFDAIINQNDSGIAAIGTIKEGYISVSLTLDHRLINGYQGAEFIRTLKNLAKDTQWFKGVQNV